VIKLKDFDIKRFDSDSFSTHLYIFEGKLGEKYFGKRTPKAQFNEASVNWQTRCDNSKMFNGKFKINKFITHLSTKRYVYSLFEFVDNQEPFEVNTRNCRLFGSSLAKLHNLGAEEFVCAEKHEHYESLDAWTSITPSGSNFLDSLYTQSLQLREDAFNLVDPILDSQPKVVCHRDFKFQNIVYDGSDYHLIDFDFLARDFAAIECGIFLTELDDPDHLEAFLKAYITDNTVLDPEHFYNIPDAAVKYLCCNAFPFYVDSVSEQTKICLANDRNARLRRILSNFEMIKIKIESILD